MVEIELGLVHTPVTPFAADRQIDFETYELAIDFHIRNGADTLAVQMHAGESVSLSDAEQRALLDRAVERADGRVPVVAHVSDAGTGIAADRARHAERVGASAVIATIPYYWTPPPAMLVEHFAQIGSAVDLPFYVLHTPSEMGGSRLSVDVAMRLLDRLPNFVGLVDASLDWQFMINVLSAADRARPGFQLLAGAEYLVSASAIGAVGMFTSLGGVAPGLIRRLYELCQGQHYFAAREPQEDVAALYQVVKRAGPGGLKSAMRAMGRDCGDPRPPLEAVTPDADERVVSALAAMPALGQEPRGW